jgi:hypothetical protein
MPQFSFFIRNRRSRVKYPRSFDLPDLDAARLVAIKIAATFTKVVSYWKDLPSKQRSAFAVEVSDGAGQTVLTVPFNEAEEIRS